MRFTISGVPVAKARPRFSTRGGFPRAYDIQTKEKNAVIAEVKDIVRQALDSENKPTAIEASNLASAEFYDVTLVFHQPVPKSCTIAERNAKLWGLEKCTTKPDLDNMQKFYLDCFNEQLYEDDRFVIKMQTAKSYTRNPRIEVNIMPGSNNLGECVNGILRIFGPDQLTDLLRTTWELYDLYGRDEEGDWVEDAVGIENVDEVRLSRTAYILSSLADQNAKLFDKINKRYPGFYKLAEKLAEQQKAQGQN